MIARRAVLVAPIALPFAAAAQWPLTWLFRVSRTADQIRVGLTQAGLDALGDGPADERLARALERDGRVVVWLYVLKPWPGGGTRYQAEGRTILRREEVLRIDLDPTARVIMPPPE